MDVQVVKDGGKIPCLREAFMIAVILGSSQSIEPFRSGVVIGSKGEISMMMK